MLPEEAPPRGGDFQARKINKNGKSKIFLGEGERDIHKERKLWNGFGWVFIIHSNRGTHSGEENEL